MKIKRCVSRLMVSGFMLFCIWVLSLLPSHVINVMATVSFVGCFILAVLLACLTWKRKHLWLIGFLIFSTQVCMAQDAETCADSFRSSVGAGRWCIYSLTVEKYGAGLCNYVHSFNPTKAQKEGAERILQEHVNMADQIVQAYNDLDKTRQGSVDTNCKLLSAEDRDAKIDFRIQKLHSNSTPVCCAWALQTLNQIYNSQYAERQVQTVPMMLANDKVQCWPCDVVYLLIVLVNTMSFGSAPAMARAGLFFLKWMFIFWLAVKIGMLFFNYGSDRKAYSGTKFLQELFIRVLFVLVAALVLNDTAAQYDENAATVPNAVERDATMLDQAYEKIVNPVFELVTSFGIELSHTLLDGQTSFYGKVSEAVKKQSDPSVSVYAPALEKVNYCSKNAKITISPVYQYLAQPNILLNSGLKITGPGQFIGDDLSTSILCLSQLSFRGPAPIAAIGSIFVSHAIKNALPITPLPGRLPLMPQIFYGLLLNILCWLIGIVIAFKLIDIIVRVALVVMLSPVFVAVAPFPVSRGYAMKGVKFFLSALMSFVEVALAVGVIVPFFYKAIAGSNEQALIKAIVAPSSKDYVPNLYAQFSDGSCRVLIYILGVAWLAKNLFSGVQRVFQKIFGVAFVGGMAGKSTLSTTQKSVRSAIGSTYDSYKKVKRNSKDFKWGFVDKMGDDNAFAWAGSAAGNMAGRVSGHVSAAKQNFYDAARRTSLGRAAISTKNKLKGAANKTKAAVSKVGYVMGAGLQKGGGHMVKFGANMSKAGFGLGALAGIPVMLAGAAVWTGGTASRVVGKATKTLVKRTPAYIKNQARKGVYQFFHPDNK